METSLQVYGAFVMLNDRSDVVLIDSGDDEEKTVKTDEDNVERVFV